MSQSADRLDARPLDGEVIFGKVFIFFDNSRPDIDIGFVEFFIDGKLENRDFMAPYDLVDAESFDTGTLKESKDAIDPALHRMLVRVTLTTGASFPFEALFRVDNNLTPLETSPSLLIVTATADVAAGRLTLEGFNLTRNLDKGFVPEVALDLQPLDIEFFDDLTLRATLPAGISVGDHLVNVSTDGKLVPGAHDSDHAELLVTIGATNLSCVGCVSAPEVSFPYAGSAVAGGKAFEASLADFATNAAFATNADLLDGFDSTAFADAAHTHPSLETDVAALDSRVSANEGAITALESGVGVGVGGQSNPLQVAQLRWYAVNQIVRSFPVGNWAGAVVFDGINIWVADALSTNVTKLRASDGANLGTFSVGGVKPDGLAFDGANIWVANQLSSTVTKLRASDGALLDTFPLDNRSPIGIAFDGANMWTANRNGTVTKLRTSDGEILGDFAVGVEPRSPAFDGANIWVANQSSSTVTKLQASDGATLGTFAVGPGPNDLAFDGANIWVSSTGSNNVTKLRASDGANLGTFDVGHPTGAVVFDGVNIWVAGGNNGLTKLRPRDGAVLDTFSDGRAMGSLAFDGVNLWVAHSSFGTVSKL